MKPGLLVTWLKGDVEKEKKKEKKKKRKGKEKRKKKKKQKNHDVNPERISVDFFFLFLC